MGATRRATRRSRMSPPSDLGPGLQKRNDRRVDGIGFLRLALRQGDGFWSRSPSTELLARNDLGLGDKLIELERL